MADWKNKGFKMFWLVLKGKNFDRWWWEKKVFQTFQGLDRGHNMNRNDSRKLCGIPAQ